MRALSLAGRRVANVASACLGAALGGVVGGFVVVGVTLVLKAGMDFAAGQSLLYIVTVPLLGLVVATLVLHGIGTTADARHPHPWRAFPPGAVQADITGDVVDSAGEEERFPWRLTPIRTLAIFATVGLGGDGDGGASGVLRCRCRRLPRRSRSLVAPASPARGPGGRCGGRGCADGDPAGRDGVHARTRPRGTLHSPPNVYWRR